MEKTIPPFFSIVAREEEEIKNKNNRGSDCLGQQNGMYWGSSAHMWPCCYESCLSP
jgi:hypothetical protein